MLGDSDVIGKRCFKTKMAGKIRPFLFTFIEKLDHCFWLFFEHERDLIGSIDIHGDFSPAH